MCCTKLQGFEVGSDMFRVFGSQLGTFFGFDLTQSGIALTRSKSLNPVIRRVVSRKSSLPSSAISAAIDFSIEVLTLNPDIDNSFMRDTIILSLQYLGTVFGRALSYATNRHILNLDW